MPLRSLRDKSQGALRRVEIQVSLRTSHLKLSLLGAAQFKLERVWKTTYSSIDTFSSKNTNLWPFLPYNTFPDPCISYFTITSR